MKRSPDSTLKGERILLADVGHSYVPDALLCRAQRRRELEVYAFSLRQWLPRCRIPLRPPDPDAVLDLPAVFDRCYDVGGYDLLIDYSRPPAAPLRDEEAAWVLEEGFQSRQEGS